MLASFLSLLTLATIVAAAFGVGRPLIRAMGVAEDDALATGVYSVAAGLVAAGTVVSFLGFAGLLYKGIIGVLTLGAAFYGIALLGQTCRRRETIAEIEGSQNLRPAAAPPSAPLRQGIACLAIIAAAGSLVAALAPPTAGDALCYHLELPKRFLLEHSVVYLPDTDNSTYPLLAEMWYLWALALDGPVAAQLLHWGLGVLLALATVVLATAIIGRPWAWCAGGAVLLVPGVSNQMTAPLNDVALAAMTTLALAAAWRAAIDREHRGWYVLAGWLAGGALAIKYLAIAYFAAAALVLLGVAAGRGQRRSLLTGGAAAAVVALAIAGPWYVRSTWYTGNPVHPFFDDVIARLAALNVSDTTDPLRTPHSAFRTSSTAPRTVLACALAPWQLTMHPENFGGRGHQLGVLFLATLPGLVLCRRLRGLRTLLSIGVLYFLAWYLLRPNSRFLLPIVPLLCIAVVWVWMEWRWLPTGPRRCLACLTALVLLAGAAVAPLRARDRLPVALGIESRECFLMRREPSYPAAAWANALVTPEMHILSQEQRAFYFQARVTRENVYRRRREYDRRLASPIELGRTLQAEGFTHLLLAESSGGGIHYNPTLSRLADEALTAGSQALECLIEYTTEDADGGVRKYRLMALR